MIMNHETLFLVITTDKFELPIYVSKYPMEIQEKFNISENFFWSMISNFGKYSGKHTGFKLCKVIIQGGDED